MPAAQTDEPRAKVAPFQAMRQAGKHLEVQVDDDTWYRLERIGETGAAELVAFAERRHGARWWKRLTEDLPLVLEQIGDPMGPGGSVDLVLRPVAGGRPVVMRKVAMTAAKRRALWEANRARERGAGERSPTAAVPAAVLGRDAIETDLRALRTLLDERFAYRRLGDVDLDAVLRAARERLASEGDAGVTVPRFAREVERVLAAFGDGHAGVDGDVLAGERWLPFLVADAAGGAVAFGADRSQLLDAAHPFLVELDGRPLADWLAAAGAFVAEGSAALRRSRALRHLRAVDALRAELGLPVAAPLLVTLADPAGKRVTRELPLAERKPLYGTWPRTEHAVLEGNVGYLRLSAMDDDSRFLDELDAAMQRLRETRGLIVDVRGNGGGSREPLRRLFPYFLRRGDAPRVANVAAYRLGPGDDPQRADGYLDDRFLWPAQWRGWSAEARRAIAAAQRAFAPQWKPPAGQFSDWHFFVLQANDNPKAFPYERPVVVLQDETCFSATDVFLGAFSGWRDVTLLGTASGGGSARRRMHALPRSGLRVGLASMASFRPDGRLYDGNGVAPDVVVERAPRDLVGGGDAQLDAALARLRR